MAIDFFKIGQAAYGGGADVSKAIGEGLQKSQQIFMAYLGEQKAKREKADALTAQYIAKIPNVNAISKIPEWMKADVNNYLVSEKQKYADTARALANMSSSDPAYMNTLNSLQDIQNNFINLNNQLNQFQEDTKEYALDVDNGEISQGFKIGEADKYNQTASVYTGNAKLNIQNGQLIFNVNGEQLNYSNGEVGNYFAPDSAVQTEIDKVALLVENDGLKGTSFDSKKDFYARRVQNALQQGGKERLLSLVYDDDPRFATAAGLQTPEILTAINTKDYGRARALIADELLKGIETTHATFLSQYKDKQEAASKGTKPSKEQDSKNIAADVFNMVIQDPVAYAKTKLRGNFKEGKGNIITLIMDGEDKRFDLKRGDQFMEFMDIVTKNSNQLSGTAAGTQQAGREFYNLTLRARNMLNNREEGLQQVKEKLMPQFYAPFSQSDLPILNK